MSKQNLFIVIFVLLIINILTFGYIFSSNNITEKESNLTLRQRYSLLSPRIFTENQNDRLVNFVELRNKLNTYHTESNASMGTYFEYLPSGVSIGVNDRQNFIQASLLKTPLIMGVYKQIENGDLNKNDMLKVTEEDIDKLFGNLWEKGAGFELSVYDAIKYTLINSDNTAKNVLFSVIPDGTLENVFDSLDIPKDAESEGPVVSPKNYSSILRSLYLSSYLTEENSNEILNLLSQTPFNDKLAAGVPGNIKIAHKIGVHTDDTDKGKSVYTDCGIIYIPKRPYILCIMTNENEEDARKHMTEISRIVYEYVAKTNYEKK